MIVNPSKFLDSTPKQLIIPKNWSPNWFVHSDNSTTHDCAIVQSVTAKKKKNPEKEHKSLGLRMTICLNN